MKRLILVLSSIIVVLAASGCSTVRTTTTTYRPVQTVRADGLTLGDLLVMLNQKKPQAEIVADIKAKGLRSAPSQADLDVLAANGAEAELVNTVAAAGQQLPTAVEDSTATQTVAHHDIYWWPTVGFGYYWGYPYGYYRGPRAYSYYHHRGPYVRPPPLVLRPPPGVFRPPSISPGHPFRGPVIRPPGRRR